MPAHGEPMISPNSNSRRLFVISIVVVTCVTSCRFARGQKPVSASPTASRTTAEAPPADSITESLSFETGRNDYVITVDDTPRKFIVHVPASYDASQPVPVVFMYHGTNGSGAAVYESTHWAAKAEEANIIVVYPTSWRYFLLTENDEAGKWNDVGLDLLTGPDAQLKDDVKFTRAMLDLVRDTFNVDEKRIFATGFSNGGGFVSTRLMIEMADTFAAFASSGSGTKLSEAGFAANMPPAVSRSYYSIMGTRDDVISAAQDVPLPFPIDADAIAAHELFGPMLVNTATYLNLDAAQYDVLHPQSEYTVFVFDRSLSGADNEYIFQMVEGMFHVYPDGQTVPAGLDAVEVFWEFFMRHPMD
jgi:polyhydroxybutyrate depolymerase